LNISKEINYEDAAAIMTPSAKGAVKGLSMKKKPSQSQRHIKVGLPSERKKPAVMWSWKKKDLQDSNQKKRISLSNRSNHFHDSFEEIKDNNLNDQSNEEGIEFEEQDELFKEELKEISKRPTIREPPKNLYIDPEDEAADKFVYS